MPRPTALVAFPVRPVRGLALPVCGLVGLAHRHEFYAGPAAFAANRATLSENGLHPHATTQTHVRASVEQTGGW
ncbi:hypothetical protein ACIBBE_00420 [Streptomyces sp. NPDC051644]|uniref:hypothetical protein n=1 Tax=Streptomyces sp. NPDC051644 TaxID=3365666 RepID=UPI0037ABBF05